MLLAHTQIQATPVILTVQTQSPTHINSHVYPESGPQDSQRQLLGAIEATQSSVVDVENTETLLPYEISHVQNVPTLSLLNTVDFDNVSEVWSFEYETMSLGTQHGQINRYYRVMYFTRSHHTIGASDSANKCLEPGTTYVACLRHLRAEYIVLESGTEALDETPKDRVGNNSWGGFPHFPITSTLESHPLSARQTVSLRIPHAWVRSALARERNSTRADSDSYGEVGSQPALDFGIGMMFMPIPDANTGLTPPNNVLVFDMFTVLENTFEQLAITKRTAYSIATHVSFWTAMADNDHLTRVVTIEYLLDVGHLLTDIKISANEGVIGSGGQMRPVSAQDCAVMQSRIDTMANPHCLARQKLCEPIVLVDGEGANVQTWVTVVFPIPGWHTSEVFQFNTLLYSNLSNANHGSGMLALSTLNFFTSHAPRVECMPATAVSFDATRHVHTELYRGHALQAESITGVFSVFNDTSLSSAEALSTLVLRPDDTPEALAYFQKYTDERLRLDQLYMSHGKIDHVFPSQINNRVQGTGDGRTTLTLDAELLTRCPLLISAPGPEDESPCITTNDWGLTGQKTRIGSSVYYVHQVFGTSNTEAEDLAWLANNVFGTSDPLALKTFRDAVLSRPFLSPSAAQRKPYAAIFWIWPVFLWPNTAPIGLVDKTVISMAWSIAP